TGLVPTGSQEARAQGYIDYVRSVADCPAFVGCHWFQYVDEPTTGRWFDGENYNIGLVTIVDSPYPEMVAAARRVHAEMYRRRFERAR
ncbi:MAG TPA: agarase, partial [Candidatus Hydrogenedentes bacterium]|nr:agarase [Candidatus Hydrogenedentota bacterium]